MLSDLGGVVVPVVVSVAIMTGGAIALRLTGGGPAQAAYNAALEARLKLLQSERDELAAKVAALESDMRDMRREIADLEREVRALTAENLELRRMNDLRGAHPNA